MPSSNPARALSSTLSRLAAGQRVGELGGRAQEGQRLVIGDWVVTEVQFDAGMTRSDPLLDERSHGYRTSGTDIDDPCAGRVERQSDQEACGFADRQIVAQLVAARHPKSTVAAIDRRHQGRVKRRNGLTVAVEIAQSAPGQCE